MRMGAYYDQYWRERLAQKQRWDSIRTRRLKFVLARIRPGVRVLDYGCGTGDFVAPMQRAGAEVYGVDVSDVALSVARKKAPRAHYRLLTAEESLPFSDGEFDCVIAMEVVEHVFDLQSLFRELNRVSKPGGTLLVSCPYHGVVKNVLISLLWFEEHFNPDSAHIRFYTVRSLTRVLNRHGFGVRRVVRFGWFWPVYRVMLLEAVKYRAGDAIGAMQAEGPLKGLARRLLRYCDRFVKSHQSASRRQVASED